MTICWKHLLLGTAVLLGLLSACGGGTDRTKAQVRLVNASDYPSFEWRVDDQLRQSAVVYGGTEAYLEVDPGKAATRIGEAGSATALLSFTPALSERRHFTLLTYGPLGALKQQLLDENLGAPDNNRSLLRVFNAASDAGPLDVYLTAAADTLDRAVPLQAAAAYGTAGAPITLDSGSWRLRVTAAGSKTDVRLDVLVVLASKSIGTLVLTPTTGGVLVRALLLQQQAGITSLQAQQSRLRVAAGLTDGATVGVAFDPQAPPVTAVASPALGEYGLVASGTGLPALSVNGQSVVPVAVDRKPGADYTLLVYGTPAAPRTAWIADDNRLSNEPTKARLRLINGLADQPVGLTLTLDALPVANGVLPGTASVPFVVEPTLGGNTNGALAVTAQGARVFVATDQQLRAGSVYSVFAVGRAAAATGIVRRDR